jgi:hypothetical protein
MKSKVLAEVTAVLLSAAIGVTFAAPSYAGTTLQSQAKIATSAAAVASTPADAGPLCEGFGGNPPPAGRDTCNLAPYTTHNYQNVYNTSYWGMPPDQDTAPGHDGNPGAPKIGPGPDLPRTGQTVMTR